MKNILVPTDFSATADIAIDAAVTLAKKHKAKLFLMHSIKSLGDIVQLDSFASGDFASTTVSTEQILKLIDLKMEEANDNLNDLKKSLTEKGLNVDTCIKQQPVDVAVNEIISSNQIDLVVMGSHGASGITELIIGSNAQKVVRNAKCPVLILKNKLTNSLSNMVYASNFQEDEVNQNLPIAAEISKKFGAELHYLFVNTPGYFEDSETTYLKMENALKNVNQQHKHIYNDFSVEDGILAFAKRNNMDAIAITTHGYKAFRRLFNNNVVEHLVNHANRPILIFNLNK